MAWHFSRRSCDIPDQGQNPENEGLPDQGTQGTHFKMKIILGTVLVVVLVFRVIIPGCLQKSSGLHSDL